MLKCYLNCISTNLKPLSLKNNKNLLVFRQNFGSYGSFRKMSSDDKLSSVPEVDIDIGTFKYILINLHGDEMSKFIIRGYTWAGYHADIYERVDAELSKLGLDCECVGGGRIRHSPDKKTILVYGYSQGYGKADHSIAVKLLKKKYPGYEKISWSDEGY